MSEFRSRLRIVHNSGRNSSRESQVTTGKRCFVDIGDVRSAWAKRWGDLILAHANDFGGLDMLSETQLSICRRVATVECELEAMEGRMSASQPVDIGQYARLTGCLSRLFELLGLKGHAPPLDPTSALARALEAYADPPDDEEPDEA
jgi:hypothetical protein